MLFSFIIDNFWNYKLSLAHILKNHENFVVIFVRYAIKKEIRHNVVPNILKKEKNKKNVSKCTRSRQKSSYALNSISLISLQMISDVDLRWRAAISFYASTSFSFLFLFLSLSLSLSLSFASFRRKTPDLSSPFTPFHKLPVRLSRLVRTTSMIIRFCIAKCLCLL